MRSDANAHDLHRLSGKWQPDDNLIDSDARFPSGHNAVIGNLGENRAARDGTARKEMAQRVSSPRLIAIPGLLTEALNSVR